jgi:tRNA (cmo5U34)-methyltransferase
VKATSSDPHGRHDWHSSEYVEQWIADDVARGDNRNDDLGRLVRLLPYAPDADISVLEVGAGYGRLTRLVLDELVNSHVVVHDFSSPMLARARKNLAADLSRVQFVASDLREVNWSDAVGRGFDAVVSASAIHNVRDPTRIRAVYDDICRLVKQGGCFINFDLVEAVRLDTPPNTDGDAEPCGSLLNQLRWLVDAGFGAVDCFWRIDRYAAIGGIRMR